MSVLVVIPARYGAVRFPGKPLAAIAGKPMIQHVYERAAQAKQADAVVVATDDARIAETVRGFHGAVAMTDPAARSGTERIAEVARGRTEQVVVNVQGDEPLIRPEMVNLVTDFLLKHPAVPMASVMTPLASASDGANPNVVKVVVDQESYALYFSRAPIPFQRDNTRTGKPANRFWKHVGLYGYQRHFLLQFPSLEPTPLEQAEGLEQLRALEHGYRIKMLQTAHDTVGVDTPEDLARVESLIAKTVSRLNLER